MADNRHMDVLELLESAALLVPEDRASGNDVTASDVWEYLAADDWELALGLLEELTDTGPLPVPFWESLAAAAEGLRMERSAAWCHWRCSELRNGVVLADLTLRPAAEAPRTGPVPGAGVLRPMWDLGERTADGEPAVRIAGMWVERTDFLEPGGQGRVRLVPLVPSGWLHVEPGQEITMYETRVAAGTAVVVDVRPPVGLGG
ncbi:hypothetical protein [Streptomyces siamensis]|uniref:Uncharacterized protein n=1 Tax=Streptomyces siamensis TaxID=1274986 RepID=A0ABP9IRM9_9ACTN